MPDLIVIAGPNGAGKSTAAPVILQNFLRVHDFVNADVIAKGLSAFQPEKEAIRAGRIMLNRIRDLAGKGEDFAFETTLASRTFAPWMLELKQQGYRLHLVFLWLKDADLAVSRVKTRVELGGHHIPEKTIRRRYNKGVANFFNLYRPLLDSWKFYDNSDSSILSLVASGAGNKVVVENKFIWDKLQEGCSE